MRQTSYSNKLIRCMTPGDFDALRPHLEPMQVRARQVLVPRNALVPYIYFLESGQISVLAKVTGSEPIEVAMIGREGMTNMAPAKKVPLETLVQVPGDAHRIERDVFVAHLRQSADLAEIESRWQHILLLQTSFSALSRGSFTVVERLARYMLMLHDRIDGDELPMVHDYFAWMLAVRRAGVTDAVGSLKKLGAVQTGRALSEFLIGGLLIQAAEGSYGQPEAEYQKLFGVRRFQGRP
jgi:CRP-like cAMP-binding protein